MRISDLAHGGSTPTEAFMASACMQAGDTPSVPYILSYAPVASMNPFQSLLYCRASQAGFAVVPTLKLEDLASVSWRGRSVIHLHWLASVLKGVESLSAARNRIDIFKNRLSTWRATGHKLVWSMHNILPHECENPEAEVELRRVLVEGVDAIHLLSEGSADEARRHYDVPESKLFHVPHPSYEGWYANVADAKAARLDLGVSPGDFVFLLFGALQRYKGVLELVDAFERLQETEPRRRVQLIIAGKPVDTQYVAEIRARVRGSTSIRFVSHAMEERQIQTLFNAANVAVAPYQRTLNSGVALLAATFNRALVAPRMGGVLETFSEDPSLLYGDGAGTLLDALRRALDHRRDDMIMTRIRERHRPEAISDEFFAALSKKLSMQEHGMIR